MTASIRGFIPGRSTCMVQLHASVQSSVNMRHMSAVQQHFQVSDKSDSRTAEIASISLHGSPFWCRRLPDGPVTTTSVVQHAHCNMFCVRAWCLHMFLCLAACSTARSLITKSRAGRTQRRPYPSLRTASARGCIKIIEWLVCFSCHTFLAFTCMMRIYFVSLCLLFEGPSPCA